jgi:hypothetical protein
MPPEDVACEFNRADKKLKRSFIEFVEQIESRKLTHSEFINQYPNLAKAVFKHSWYTKWVYVPGATTFKVDTSDTNTARVEVYGDERMVSFDVTKTRPRVRNAHLFKLADATYVYKYSFEEGE